MTDDPIAALWFKDETEAMERPAAKARGNISGESYLAGQRMLPCGNGAIFH